MEYTYEHKITYPDEIFNLIEGKGKIEDLREKFIFRGIGNVNYEFKPSALRRNGADLNKVISQSSMPLYKVDEKIIEDNNIPREKYKKILSDYYLRAPKNNEFPKGVEFTQVRLNELQIRKECTVLLNFINRADRSGLKIDIDKEIRKLLNNPDFYFPRGWWPKDGFYESLALAQHYNTPTRFLDWSYDYKVSLYFAVKNILRHDETDYSKSDGVVWAFNYKLFDTPEHRNNLNETFKLQIYRPAYHLNPNLNAQKGLFTIILNDLLNPTNKEFDKEIIDDFKRNNENRTNTGNLLRSHALKDYNIPKGEKIFYKFIIPFDLKADILKELYKDGYSEEFLSPGYQGVTDSIKNHTILEEYLMNNTD